MIRQFTQTSFDVIILGGGPAGMSCAMWCADLGLSAIIIDSSPELGGQLHRIYNPITNHLGAESANGSELLGKFLSQIDKRDFFVCLGIGVESVDCRQKTVTLRDGRVYSAKNLVVATGVSRRKLGVPGEEEFVGRGVLESGMKARDSVGGRRVVVVGGGDAAVENSLILARAGANVTLVHRRSEFSCQRNFLEEAAHHPGIDIITGATLHQIRGGGAVESVVIENTVSGLLEDLFTDLVLIRVGVGPNTALMLHQLKLDRQGYILTDALQATSEDGVYAIGDVCSVLGPTISTAVGQGAFVAKVISQTPNSR